MNREIAKLRKHVIICGYGRLGQTLAQDLRRADIPFLVVDKDSSRLQDAQDGGCLTLMGDASDEEILREAGIFQARFLATVLPSDATNVFITLSAHTLNPEIEIIARGELPSTEAKLLAAGANHVVLPSTIGGRRIAELVIHPVSEGMLDRIIHENSFSGELRQIGLELRQFKIEPGSPHVGKTLGELEAQGAASYLIVALRQASGHTVYRPTMDLHVNEGESVIMIGHEGEQPSIPEANPAGETA